MVLIRFVKHPYISLSSFLCLFTSLSLSLSLSLSIYLSPCIYVYISKSGRQAKEYADRTLFMGQ